MPTPTYTPLATVTLGASATSVTFSSIPATYRDLIIVFSGSGSSGSTMSARFNSDTGSNYSRIFMGGNGSSTFSGADSDTSMGLQSGQPNQRMIIWQIMDYSATDKHKTSLLRTDDAAFETTARAFRWANTAAINTVVLNAASTGFTSGSTFSLYGVIA